MVDSRGLSVDDSREVWYPKMMNKSRRSNSHQRSVMDRRRSNAAVPHKNKAKYNRKSKYGSREWLNS